MPNVFSERFKSETPKKSRTTPNTPVQSERIEMKETRRSKPAKHVMIDNYDIVEHTPPSSSSFTREEDFSVLSTKSLPELKKTIPDYGFRSTLAGEKDYRRVPKKSFIEDGGMSVLPMATG